MAESPSVGRFLRRFGEGWLTRMSGGASVPLTAAAIYFSSSPLKAGFAVLAVVSLLTACYRVWLDSVTELQRKVVELDSEIEKLKRGDYAEEHKRLAEQKLRHLEEGSLDLLYFLLHHGKTESEELRKHCLHDPIFNESVQRACEQDLVKGSTATIPGRSGVQYFWEITPAFEAVLRDLIGRRQSVYFR